ncbi:MAG: hypothetical protein ABSB15_02510 [Bryobacteraceae bacterium]|jgi:hypothetical protein
MRLTALVCLLAPALATPQSPPLFVPRLDDPAILYESGETQDLASDLQKRLDSGQAHLEFGDKWGYLESVLRELHIPVSSQTLVFSKTSLQVDRISPEHPRAIYFGDDVYVGLVRGGLLEVAAIDPQKGAMFYVMAQKKTAHPELIRKNEECLKCHFSVNTMSVPGFLTRSVFTNSAGEPILEAGSFLTDHRSPLNQRWGGWYVTGTHGDERHLGNGTAKGSSYKIDTERGANVIDLKGRVDTAQYPEPTSDVVALMVLNHQVQMHNLITRLGYEARLNRPELAATIESTVRYMLFADEPRLRYRVTGTAPFRAEFEERGPKDHLGRSLRETDLRRRLFRYPCSFLIYSDSFEALPAAVKEPLYQRLWEVLSGKDQSPAYQSLTAADRRAVLEILVDTKPSLPEYFRSGLGLAGQLP